MGGAIMIIDGPTVERSDGSVRILGYGVDSDGKVTCRFAVPTGYDWDPPDGTKTVKFVDSMDALPDVHTDYKTRE